VNKIIAFSESTRSKIKERYDLGGEKLVTILDLLKPAHSIDQDILSHRKVKKDDYAIFYARLVPGKGIFEIPYIWKIVEKEVPDAKLIICGNFGSLRHRNAFFSLIKKLGLRNIHYKGFISSTKLYELVSGAKV